MSIKYFSKLYDVARQKGIVSALIYDTKATLYLLDIRLCNFLDYIDDYFDTIELNYKDRISMRKRLKSIRKENIKKSLEYILELN